MKNVLNTIKEAIIDLHNDVEAVRVISGYLYVIIASSALIVGIFIGVNIR